MFHMLLGLAISGGLIVWMIDLVDWTIVGAEIAQGQYWVLLPCTLLFVIHGLCRAIRWRYLLPSAVPVKIGDLFNAIMLVNFGNIVLPLRAGEILRPYFLSNRSGHSFSTGFASIVIERFFDTLILLASFSILIQTLEGLPDWIHEGAFSISLIAGLVLLFIIIGIAVPRIAERLIVFFTSLLPTRMAKPAERFFKECISATHALLEKWNWVKVLFFSAMIWAVFFVIFWMFLFLFDIEPDPLIGISVATIVCFATAAPSAPGFIGVYQTACIAAFAIFAIEKEIAMAYAIVTHAYQFVIFVSYGGYVLSKYGLSLGDLRRASTDSPATSMADS